jgi:hypothetical protein
VVKTPYFSLAFAFLLSGCPEEGPKTSDDPCESSSDPVIMLGQGIGGAFAPFSDGEGVTLAVAPQGGFGVSVVIRTEGLSAGEDALADVQLDVEIDGQSEGSFLLTDAALLCQTGEDGGGIISGAVVGFDPDRYPSNDDLVSLAGKEAVLDVTVIDEGRAMASVRQPVTIVFGG